MNIFVFWLNANIHYLHALKSNITRCILEVMKMNDEHLVTFGTLSV